MNIRIREAHRSFPEERVTGRGRKNADIFMHIARRARAHVFDTRSTSSSMQAVCRYLMPLRKEPVAGAQFCMLIRRGMRALESLDHIRRRNLILIDQVRVSTPFRVDSQIYVYVLFRVDCNTYSKYIFHLRPASKVS